MAVRVPFVPANSPDAVGPAFEGSGAGGGYTPAEIRAAYKVPSTGGSGQTVAIVDPYNDPDIYENLQTYRAHYHLPECTKASGCFKEVNQNGETINLPKEEESKWGFEMSLDIEMASATCSECKLLLVEAENNGWENLGKAENEAFSLGANVISDSWGNIEEAKFEKFWAEWGSKYLNHGIPITVSAGDVGYGVEFPAGSPYAIAVGGTTLKRESKSERGWVEEVWSGTDSGCALKEEKKPAWQHDSGCANRTDNDVSAVASASTPVSLYDSFGYKGWEVVGGTSVSSPIVAGIEALAEKSTKELGAKIFYELPGHEFEVTKGSNGTCTPEYLCTAGKGYNGPAGMGALDGVPTLGPAATTGTAKSITEKEVIVHGKVNPEGAETKYYFEYGTTEKYGEKTAETNAGSGTSSVEVSKTITGLTANTKYYYRIVTKSSKGASDVGGQEFCTHWCLQEAPLPEGAALWNGLKSVSCTSSTECIAVGEFRNSKEVGLPLAERWNGIEWSIQEPPTPAGAKYGELSGVSCTSSTSCVAAGYFENSSEKRVPLAERWNGTTWSVEQPPVPSGGHFINYVGAVSCTSSTACTTVGETENSSGDWVPLAERWNGKEWSLQEPPAPSGTTINELSGISCTSSAECIAVGHVVSSSEKRVPLAERWNGTTWSAQELPIPKEATGGSYLGSVSCTSSTECIAVGSFEKGSSTKTLVPMAEKWNGKEWSVQEPSPPLPTGATNYNALTGVSCTSSTECIAVGYFDNPSIGGYAPLADRWNGKEWSVQEPPDLKETTEAMPAGVSCIPSAECTAVGNHNGGGPGTRLLVERYQY